MTGKDFQKVLTHDVLKPLNLSRTFYDTPDISLGVVPNSRGQQFWNFALGDESP